MDDLCIDYTTTDDASLTEEILDYLDQDLQSIFSGL